MKKVESDLEKMNRERIEMERIKAEGISNVDDLVLYVSKVIEDVMYNEDLARLGNNPIIYSEAIGIRREFEKLGKLIFKAVPTEEIDGTEEKHRTENDGSEAYI